MPEDILLNAVFQEILLIHYGAVFGNWNTKAEFFKVLGVSLRKACLLKFSFSGVNGCKFFLDSFFDEAVEALFMRYCINGGPSMNVTVFKSYI